jgi:hypothetical protein
VYGYPYYPIYPYYPLDYQSNQDYSSQPNVVYVVPPNGYSQPSAPPQQQQQTAPDAAPSDSASSPPAKQSAPDEPVEPTMLVFRDGHTKEISNYAIVGKTLFVFAVPKSKIALADLDIPATVKVNEDRGVSFNVPGTAGH